MISSVTKATKNPSDKDGFVSQLWIKLQRGISAGKLDLHGADIAVHYPNIFPENWKMVTRYLLLPRVEHVMDEMAERAHCGATDSVISLTKWHRGQSGRLHFVVNYGIGLHLGVCILREYASI